MTQGPGGGGIIKGLKKYQCSHDNFIVNQFSLVSCKTKIWNASELFL